MKRVAQEVGSTVLNGGYTIEKVLSEKGMANVYLARDNQIQKLWVIKEVFKPEGLVTKKDALEYRSILNEAKILTTLSNNAIPRIVTMREEEGKHMIVMDYVSGNTVEAVLVKSDSHTLPEETVVKWISQVCATLGYLHGLTSPVLYRDLKPANIIIQPEGSVKLIDFGISKILTSNKDTFEEALGTPGYASPEQSKKDNLATLQADIYGVGAVIFKMLTGVEPLSWRKKTGSDVLDPKKVDSTISDGMRGIVVKCTEPVETRYKNIAEVLYDLRNYTEKDEGFRKRSRRRVNTARAFGIAGVLIMASSLIPLTIESASADDRYKNAVAVAEQSGQTNDYLDAIKLRPTELEPYTGLIASIKEDGVFSKEEESQLLNQINPSLTGIQQKEGYKDIAYEIGRLYWFYYGDGGKSLSVQWFKNAKDAGSDKKDIDIFLSIGEFQRTIQSAVQESTDPGMYKEYWTNLRKAESIEGGGELVDLEVYLTQAKAINNYAYNLYTDGVPKEEVQQVANNIKTRIDKGSSPGRPTEVLNKIKEEQKTIQNQIDLAYAGEN